MAHRVRSQGELRGDLELSKEVVVDWSVSVASGAGKPGYRE